MSNTIGAVCGNRYSEFGLEWGLPSSRSSPDLSNPRKITTIGARTRRHAPVRAPARKLHAPPRAAVPTVSKTHSSGHRIEQWIPPSGSSSPDLKNGVKNGLIGAATPPRAGGSSGGLPTPARAGVCQRMPSTRLAHAWHALGQPPQPARPETDPNPNRVRADPSRNRARTEPDPNRTEPI
uniref:Uncharacterized protein n=1 Tax=Fagus sylvatica TaxID=28930 RepID=A0A2N9H5G9_FAGSY